MTRLIIESDILPGWRLLYRDETIEEFDLFYQKDIGVCPTSKHDHGKRVVSYYPEDFFVLRHIKSEQRSKTTINC